MSTLLLDLTNWDLVVDAAGNIAVAQEPYATAQDVASAIKTFQGECWFDGSIGLPYFSDILGYAPPLSLVQELFVAAAKTVANVKDARCTITAFENRTLSGYVNFTTQDGQTGQVSIQ